MLLALALAAVALSPAPVSCSVDLAAVNACELSNSGQSVDVRGGIYGQSPSAGGPRPWGGAPGRPPGNGVGGPAGGAGGPP